MAVTMLWPELASTQTRILMISLFLICTNLLTPSNPQLEQLAQVIYKAEGGAKAKCAYGLVSIHCSSLEAYHQACLRTIRHQLRRYNYQHREGEPFINFLSDVYCPPASDRVGNTNWRRNVKYFLCPQ